jgi:hypothetical protein
VPLVGLIYLPFNLRLNRPVLIRLSLSLYQIFSFLQTANFFSPKIKMHFSTSVVIAFIAATASTVVAAPLAPPRRPTPGSLRGHGGPHHGGHKRPRALEIDIKELVARDVVELEARGRGPTRTSHSHHGPSSPHATSRGHSHHRRDEESTLLEFVERDEPVELEARRMGRPGGHGGFGPKGGKGTKGGRGKYYRRDELVDIEARGSMMKPPSRPGKPGPPSPYGPHGPKGMKGGKKSKHYRRDELVEIEARGSMMMKPPSRPGKPGFPGGHGPKGPKGFEGSKHYHRRDDMIELEARYAQAPPRSGKYGPPGAHGHKGHKGGKHHPKRDVEEFAIELEARDVEGLQEIETRSPGFRGGHKPRGGHRKHGHGGRGKHLRPHAGGDSTEQQPERRSIDELD